MIELLGEQDEQIYLEFSTERLAALGLTYSAFARRAACAERGAPGGRGADRPGTHLPARVGRVRIGEGPRERQLRRRRPHASRCATSPPSGAASPIRRSRCSASTASPPSAWPSPCARAATSSPWAQNLDREMQRIRADLPVGIEPFLVSDQAQTVNVAINDFMESLWQAIVIILVVSFIALGVRAGRGGGARDPVDAGHRLRGDADRGDRPAPHFARRADHRAHAAGGRRDDHDRRARCAASRPATPRSRRRPSPTAAPPRRC